MGLKATALFDLPTLKRWLKVEGDEQDDILTVIGNGVADHVEGCTGRIFRQRSVTETRRGEGNRKLFVRYRPIVSIASFTNDGQALAPSDYVVDAELGLIELVAKTFAVGPGKVVITYDAGYALEDLPSDIVAAALDLAKTAYAEWSTGALTATSIQMGPASVLIRPGLNPRIDRFLAKKADTRF